VNKIHAIFVYSCRGHDIQLNNLRKGGSAMRNAEKLFCQRALYGKASVQACGWKFLKSGMIISEPVAIVPPSKDQILDIRMESFMVEQLAKRCNMGTSLRGRIVVCPFDAIFDVLVDDDEIFSCPDDEFFQKVKEMGFLFGSKIGPELVLPIYELAQSKKLPFERIVILQSAFDDMRAEVYYHKNKGATVGIITEEFIQPKSAFVVVQPL